MPTLSVRSRLILVLATMGGVALLVTVIPFFSTSSMLNQLPTGGIDTSATFQGATQIASTLRGEQSAVGRFALSGDERFLVSYMEGMAAEPAMYESLEREASRNPMIGEAVVRLKAAVATWRERAADPTIAAVRAGQMGSIDSIDAGDAKFDPVVASLTGLEAAMSGPPPELLAQITELSSARNIYFVAAVVALAFALLVSTIFVGTWVSRPLAKLVKIAHGVENGEDVVFPSMRRDEIGDLAAALEVMRRGMRAGQHRAQAAAEEARVLNQFTELAAFSESDSDLADATLTAMDELVRPDDASVHVSNQSRDRATVEARRGDSPAEPLALGAIQGCPGIRRGSLYVTPDVARPLAVRCPVYGALAGTVSCIPLTALGETIGVTHLHWHAGDALALGQHAGLSRIAEHAALSIGNRRLVATLRGAANTDARTGLVNSRGFDEAVEGVLGARSSNGHEAILMLDIDHFKGFNDRYGHPAGDEALRAFAGMVRACLRQGDLPARYGGEEFAIHLKGLDRAATLEVAERIRSRVESSMLSLGPGVTGRITVSIGIAVAPDDGVDRLTLLRAADSALYIAKSEGRNKVATTDGVVTREQTELFAVAATEATLDVAEDEHEHGHVIEAETETLGSA